MENSKVKALFKCVTCGEEKPQTEFYKRETGKYQLSCKVCFAAKVRNRYANIKTDSEKYKKYLYNKAAYSLSVVKPKYPENMEEFGDWIPGYEGLYRISKDGIITRFYPRNGKFKAISSDITKHGYVRLHLGKDGKVKSYLLHRLVAITYLPNPLNRNEINHIDGVKTNNHISNLEWCTRSENMVHAFKTGLKKSNFSNHANRSN